ncbi:MAG: 2,5-diamino-6-(ribosylamino)-4(3H)-pyrimidinone 5'-phosphate reductase [Methanobrevibacter sp.]|jgi:2,5-diamino-6-(ribosylamino)-4(3H)-pyrimidinone 5'-phosphate reductase|nr:2,5-diamino-6-(ribosylamino)-4(3H)-pyrimidinone 5'-phosphate reductase [Candidatus Methanovirga basalitermitum]
MRPYTILNAAMTLDGKIATKTGSSRISNERDVERVHKLRMKLDGIMVGINTILVDDPKLTVRKLPNEETFTHETFTEKINPVRVVVDSYGRIPINSNVLNSDAKTIIATSNKILKNRKTFSLLKQKADVFICGEKEIDLKRLMEYLYSKGIKTLMLEGGSTLSFSMFKEGLIDEVRICIGPIIVGGSHAKTLVDGDGFAFMESGVKLKMKNSYFLDECLILEYFVKKSK